MNILFGNAVIIISIIAFIAAVVVFVLLSFVKNTNRFSWNRRISLTIDNVDKYTYELYKYEKNTDGQRVWTVYRFLLDENLKSKIKSLSVDEKIAEYIIKACGPEEETQLMTWKQVRQELVNGK